MLAFPKWKPNYSRTGGTSINRLELDERYKWQCMVCTSKKEALRSQREAHMYPRKVRTEEGG
jgi:hypothetical protein